MYGPDVLKPGTFASNCLIARRLAERGVRFIQLYPRRLGPAQQPHHGQLAQQCLDTDQASAALVKDLKQRGLLDDTLVVWGGEFGRTPFAQNQQRPRLQRPRSPSAAPTPCGSPAAA
jgi:arylsulfatase A-like enzyme